ncbi:alanine--tRNA ligase [Blattabacterium cuenoti]|uniref:alanine--tRNA ligase n=1 Tax=Blattabacterium cuenoti TaxID=1653831 RepID=UPI00163D3B1F|nr:alanine--tRNA ligase [Blattabacterium cuenoti]
MKYKFIKEAFLNFFKKKKHKIIPSFPIYSKNDPTLFFINAGMNPFKDYFLGHKNPEFKRIVNIQKCLRITGKHNDLENVGYDNYHHTMFEMLGNWSFGDYSRKEAIEWAFELLITVYNIPKNNIYVSIFIGDKKDQLSIDNESLKYWKTLISDKNILFFGKKENFWEMGAIGPCGPCTEIHIDFRNEKEKKMIPGQYLINKNHPKVIEIWNLVFIEFLRKSDGSLDHLSTKHVDTGMGLERLCMVLQNKFSSYETDIFSSTIQDIKKNLGNIYKEEFNQNVSIRIIADHLRAIVFSISDGLLPSNNGSGYVIRKILRRSIIYANRFLSKKDPFIYQLVTSLVKEMGYFYPELINKKKDIQNIIKEEEIYFFKVIEKGHKKIKYIIKKTKEKNEKIIDGKIIFQLYDTYGFPIELSKFLAKKNNLLIDDKLFKKKLLEQKERSKKESSGIIKKDWISINEKNFFYEEENFIGYNYLEYNILIIKYRKVENQLNNTYYYDLVFSKTPFYPKGGGQIGDIGFIKNKFDEIFVFDTKKENSIIIHSVKKLPKDIYSSFKAIVDKKRREKIEKNHTSTHLLNFALKKILGNHIQQKGSYIGDDYLRFDFYHYKKITYEELYQIEDLVQKLIFSNFFIEEKIFLSLEEAKKNVSYYSDIFEEKYKKKIRLITFGNSSEFCIGTHVKKTGLIQIFKIISETSASYGIRRIKAITYKKAIQYLKNFYNQYNSLKDKMKYPENPIKSFVFLQDHNKKLEKKILNIHSQQIKILKKEYSIKAIKLSYIKYICDINEYQEKEFDMNVLKKTLLDLRHEIFNLFMILGFIKNGKPTVFISISDYIIKNNNIHANQIICKMADHIHGKYWGKSFFATTIGIKKNGLQLVFKDSIEFIKKTFMD